MVQIREMKSHQEREKAVKEADEETVAWRTVPSTVEAMHVHDGGNKMTEVLQRNVESKADC